MQRYGLLGEKLGHSYSKLIHEYVYQHLHLDASYTLLECREEELASYIEQLRTGVFAGFNVTIPYKKTIINYLDELDEKAKAIGSVNTVYLKNGRVIGTNTDYDGFLATIQKYQIDVLNKECYVLGTGGASLAIAKVLKDLGGLVCFVSRTPKEEQISYLELENKKIDILVNTTPVGMYPHMDDCPVSDSIIQKSTVVMDIIFNPKQTKLLKKASSKINGLWMLVMQAIKADEIWQQQAIHLDLKPLLVKLEG